MPYPLPEPRFAHAARAAPRVGAHERAAQLISSYPNLSHSQIENLAGLFPRLSALDLSLMMSDDDLAPRLEAFYAAHRELISPSLSDYAVIGAIVAFPIVALLALMLAGQI